MLVEIKFACMIFEVSQTYVHSLATEHGRTYGGCMQMPSCVRNGITVRKKIIKRTCTQTSDDVREDRGLRERACSGFICESTRK